MVRFRSDFIDFRRFGPFRPLSFLYRLSASFLKAFSCTTANLNDCRTPEFCTIWAPKWILPATRSREASGGLGNFFQRKPYFQQYFLPSKAFFHLPMTQNGRSLSGNDCSKECTGCSETRMCLEMLIEILDDIIRGTVFCPIGSAVIFRGPSGILREARSREVIR